MKILFWDGDGFVIWYKRLEKGTFSCKWGSEVTLDRRAFLMLLEGITPKRLQSRFSL
jgi:transposase